MNTIPMARTLGRPTLQLLLAFIPTIAAIFINAFTAQENTLGMVNMVATM